MPGIDFRLLRSEVGMEAVLTLLGFVPSQRHGAQVRGPCPVHRPASPRSRSFSANLAKNACRCFRCGLSGNQLDLWAAATRQPLYQAAIKLCARLTPHPSVRASPGKYQKIRASQLTRIEVACGSRVGYRRDWRPGDVVRAPFGNEARWAGVVVRPVQVDLVGGDGRRAQSNRRPPVVGLTGEIAGDGKARLVYDGAVIGEV